MRTPADALSAHDSEYLAEVKNWAVRETMLSDAIGCVWDCVCATNAHSPSTDVRFWPGGSHGIRTEMQGQRVRPPVYDLSNDLRASEFRPELRRNSQALLYAIARCSIDARASFAADHRPFFAGLLRDIGPKYPRLAIESATDAPRVIA